MPLSEAETGGRRRRKGAGEWAELFSFALGVRRAEGLAGAAASVPGWLEKCFAHRLFLLMCFGEDVLALRLNVYPFLYVHLQIQTHTCICTHLSGPPPHLPVHPGTSRRPVAAVPITSCQIII